MLFDFAIIIQPSCMLHCCMCVGYSFLHGGDGEEEEGGEITDKLQVSDNETINVFSIASGHLYERFLRYVYTCGRGIR